MDAEEKEKALKSFKPLLRGVVQSNPRGVLISDLAREYRLITFSELPVRKLGCRSVEELLRLCSDTVMCVGGLVRPVLDESTAHLQEMLNRQKKPKKKKRTFARPPPGRPSFAPSGGSRSSWGGGGGSNSFRPGSSMTGGYGYRPGGSYPGGFTRTVTQPTRSFPSPFGSSAQRSTTRPMTNASPSRTNGYPSSSSSPGFTSPSSVSVASQTSASPSHTPGGNAVTLTSPDDATLSKQIYDIVKDVPQGLFMARVIVLYKEKYRRDLSASIARERLPSMSCLTVEINQATNIPIVYARTSAGSQPPAVPVPSQSATSQPASRRPVSTASTQQASKTTIGLSSTVQSSQHVPPPATVEDDLLEHPHCENNYKNKLTTFVVKKYGPGAKYIPVYDSWPEDDGTFTASVQVDEDTFWGHGKTAKKSHFVAAKKALETLQNKAPRSATVPRSLGASDVKEVAEQFAKAVHLSEVEQIASEAPSEREPASSSRVEVVPPSRMARPPTLSAPHPASFSVWKDVCKKSGFLDVHITSVQGPYCIYATLFENRGICSELERVLTQYSEGCGDLQPLRMKKEKSVCLVRGDEGRAFRAVVEYLDMDNKEVVVRYLDHGDTDRVPFNELYELPEDVYWPEYQAFKLVLNNLTTDGDGFTQLTSDVEELILDKDMVADILFQMDLNDERLWVDLWDTSGPEDINVNEMLRSRYKTTQEFHMELPPPGDSLLVRITQLVVGARDVSLFVQRAQNSSFIDKMVKRMTRHFDESERASRAHSLLAEDELVVNRRCCVRKDEMWYRATIKSVMPDKKMCEVFLLDFGYSTVVRRIELRHMYSDEQDSGDIIHLPPQCKECHLAGIVPQFELSRSTESYVSAVTDRALRLTVVSKGKDGQPDKVRVFFTEQGLDLDLSQRLMDIHQGRFTKWQMADFIAARNGREAGSESPRRPAMDFSIPVQQLTPPLPLPSLSDTSKHYTPVIVLQVFAPDCFAVALQTTEMTEQYNELESLLASDSTLRAPLSRPYRWSVGDICAAPVEGDFFRCRIIALEDKDAEVFLLDDGSKVTVASSLLRELPDKAWDCPFQIFFARLYGVAPVPDASDGNWPPAAHEEFKRLTKDKTLQACFMPNSPHYRDTETSRAALVQSPVRVLLLVDVSGDLDLYIHRKLVTDSLAIPLPN